MIEQIYLFFVGFLSNEFVQFNFLMLIPIVGLAFFVSWMLERDLKKDAEKKRLSP